MAEGLVVRVGQTITVDGNKAVVTKFKLGGHVRADYTSPNDCDFTHWSWDGWVADVNRGMIEIDSEAKMGESFKLYLIRNTDGQVWWQGKRSFGDNPALARMYVAIQPARASVSRLSNRGYAVELVEFMAENPMVLDESERVNRLLAKKAEREARWKAERDSGKLREYRKQIADLERRIKEAERGCS